jgi:competence protein ComEA
VPPPAPAGRSGANAVIVAAAALVLGSIVAIAVVALVLVVGAGAGAVSPGTAPSVEDRFAALVASPQPRSWTPAAMVVVDVSGGVMQPGLRTLSAGDRVGDAISAAGGFAPRADLAETSRTVNLAQPLTDGMKVLVPELGADPGPEDPSVAADDGRIDLNSASQSELESLPGIGPVTAQRIIEARDEQPFQAVDELRDREVVGGSVFEDIRDLVRAGGR